MAESSAIFFGKNWRKIMKKFLTFGEPLAVFSSEDLNASLVDAKHFTRYLAGAELNVAVGIARLGLSTEYITALGKDPFGKSILKDIRGANIGTQYIELSEKYRTGFYFKQRVDRGDPEIFYYRSDSAASHYDVSELSKIDFSEIGHIHTSGITAGISEEGRVTTEKLLDLGKSCQIKTTFDPNIRVQLWESKQYMIKVLNELAAKARIVLPGINEGKVLAGSEDPEKIADFYLNQSDVTELVVVKIGPDGAFLKTKDADCQVVPGFKAEKVIDTVGAGDGFALGLISGLMENLSYAESVRRGCAIGALAVQNPGDNDGYPTREKLNEFMGRG
jgi:2-dehydro-3-deoxygluconokinase